MVKSQRVRLVDVFLLGPFIMYAASKARMNDTERAILWGAGLLTVTYNLHNYLTERAR